MFSARWKFLIVSIIVYQALLTWCLFELVDTAAFLGWNNCEHCKGHLFGYILAVQPAWYTAVAFSVLTLLLVAVNVIVWVLAGREKKVTASPPRRPVTLADGVVWEPLSNAADKDADVVTLANGSVWVRKSKDANSESDSRPT